MIISKGSIVDIPEIASLLVQTWKQAYKEIFPAAFLKGLNPKDQQKRHARYLADEKVVYLILRDQSTLVGFISFGPIRDPRMKGAVEIYAFYIRPDYQMTGCGSKLFEAFLFRSEAQYVSVEVFKDNPYLSFYLQKGFEKRDEGVIDIGGVPAIYFICEWGVPKEGTD